MKTINCVIIDDEPLAIELLETYIEQLPACKLLASFKNAVAASDFIRDHKVDLLFLDIQMPVLSGMDFLRSLSNPPRVIFTTAYRDYAVESYELNVVDYLLKPFTFERFFKAVNKFQESGEVASTETTEKTGKEPGHIFVRHNKKHLKLNFNEILYLESIKDYIRIHTENKRIVLKDKISGFYEQLPKHIFIRTHRSYVVNREKITAYTMNDVEIGDLEIPIGGLYKDEVLKQLGVK
ncbi:response regulator [Leptobacterium flavescens]|uniref:Response regulator n=1 Tax=Leptobacterium flavescens TaxID=472055 RepID=A0A6P0UTF5_9FLAO|nr:response regulator transcription factor [Leptobacterium flavescens]NER13696.1 response regulator [Leptobacterium flavescens]